MKRIFKIAATIAQTLTVIILLTVAYLFAVQELSPSAARCTFGGGKYYALVGCVPAPKFVLPVPMTGGQ